MPEDRERVLIIPRWAADLAKEELGRDLSVADVPPAGFWDRIEIADPVDPDRPVILPDGCIDGHSPGLVSCEYGSDWL